MERSENVVHHSDRTAVRAIERGELRGVCAQRKRKLRKRGVRVFWSEWLGSWAWNPNDEPKEPQSP
jgi:hypothetical protein